MALRTTHLPALLAPEDEWGAKPALPGKHADHGEGGDAALSMLERLLRIRYTTQAEKPVPPDCTSQTDACLSHNPGAVAILCAHAYYRVMFAGSGQRPHS
jgi:hypothetical protein